MASPCTMGLFFDRTAAIGVLFVGPRAPKGTMTSSRSEDEYNANRISYPAINFGA